MPNIASLLKSEIARLARKEVRGETETLRKTVVTLKAEVSGLKKQLRALEAQTRQLTKASLRQVAVAASSPPKAQSADAEGPGFRFSAKGLAANRERLGLSRDTFGRLIGTTGQSIYAWERGASRPRAKYLPAIASLRGVGKREIAKRLETIDGSR